MDFFSFQLMLLDVQDMLGKVNLLCAAYDDLHLGVEFTTADFNI